jgi:hypothetical protein
MSSGGPWVAETIPDTDSLFYRVPVAWLKKDQRIHSGVFQQRGDAMSADWDRYSSAEETRARPTNAIRFAVVRLPVDCVRKIRGLTLKHDPIYDPDRTPPNINRAHCSVYGLEASAEIAEIGYKERVKLSLLECSGDSWEIPPGFPVSGEAMV